MKKLLILSFSILFALQASASPAVQRTPESSYSDYKNYLAKEGRVSFVDAYIQLSSVTEMETPLLEQCLEEVYLGAPSATTCLQAVKSLTSKPLNQARREILFSFLMKLEKNSSPQKSFYQDLKTGLLRTHPSLAQTFHLPTPEADEGKETVQDLEMKAWKKALSRLAPLEEVALLINGKRVLRLETWKAPKGVYQWSLVTNTHEPFVRLGTFSQFASESLKEAKPLAIADCNQLNSLDVQKFGLLEVEVFSQSKCIAHFGMSTPVAQVEHLGTSSEMVKMEKTSQRQWMWPALLLVTAGVAASLQNKKVTVEMPSFH